MRNDIYLFLAALCTGAVIVILATALCAIVGEL